MEDCTAVHTGDNLSCHSPILLKVKISSLENKSDSRAPHSFRIPAWNTAREGEINEYKRDLGEKLSNITCPDALKMCRNSFCADNKHGADCDSFLLDTLFSMVECSFKHIPLSRSSKPLGKRRSRRKNIPGWSEHVEPHRIHSNKAYNDWLLAGKPKEGALFEEKQSSNRQYRQSLRQVKRASKFHKAKSLFSAATERDLQLFSEMKKIVTGKSNTESLSETVDGAYGESEIAAKFKEVYETLYNSSESVAGMKDLEEKIKDLLPSQDNKTEVEKVTEEIVKQAVQKMKKEKVDVSKGFSSDCFKNAPNSF